MRTLGTHEFGLVVAAQAGDRTALEDLSAAQLPLVYTFVRRALGDVPDVDDVVQDTMVRAVRDLASLRAPESFRPWLIAIALRQVSTYFERSQAAADRVAPWDDALHEAEAQQRSHPHAEDLAVARLALSEQRQQVVRAARWLDPEDRALLSLWWLEIAGSLTRAELAAALGVSVAHAGVRVQRMRDQVQLSRSLVAALDAVPRCPELAGTTADWDGVPTSVWRKRILRHLRSCSRCQGVEEDLVPLENLLIPLALITVPVALTATVAKVATGASAVKAVTAAGAFASSKVGLLGQVGQLVAVHPVAFSVATAMVITGGAVAATQLPLPTPPRAVSVAPQESPKPSGTPAAPAAAQRTARPGPAKTAARSTAPGAGGVAVTGNPSANDATPTRTTSASATHRLLELGPVSLESTTYPGQLLRIGQDFAFVWPTSTADPLDLRQKGTFEVVAGLAASECFSFRGYDGRYLRHSSWRARLSPIDAENDTLLPGDATFCARPGAGAGTLVLESWNYPGWFLHRRDAEVWVDRSDGSDEFLRNSSFVVRSPLAG